MHAQQTKERFIELRGRGWSLARLSQELALSKSTCIRWQKEFRSLIDDLREFHLDSINERVFTTYEEEITRLASTVNQFDQILSGRDLSHLTTPEIIRCATTLRAELRRCRQTPKFASEPSPELNAATAPTDPSATRPKEMAPS